MKNRKHLLIFILLLSILLIGCKQAEKNITIEGQEAVISTVDQTITIGNDIYTYQMNQNEITITYPNGYVYTQTKYENFRTGSWQTPLDADGYISITELGYVDEDLLIDALTGGTFASSKEGFPVLASLFFIGLGLWAAISPDTAWYASYGWRYKNAEPSDLALFLQRFGGIVAIVIGIVSFFI